MIHLRSILDGRGDTVDYAWFCSRACYVRSFDADSLGPASARIEDGGAYPCGAEHDSADFCDYCREPIGNPLTDVGAEDVREWVRDIPFRIDPTGTLAKRAASLQSTYSYLFDGDE